MSADDPSGSKDSAGGWKPVRQLARYIGHDVSMPPVWHMIEIENDRMDNHREDYDLSKRAATISLRLRDEYG